MSHGNGQQPSGLPPLLRRPGPHGQPGGAVRPRQPGAAALPHHRAHRQRQAEGLHQPPAGRHGPGPHPGGQRPRHLRRPPVPVQGVLVGPLRAQPGHAQPHRAAEKGQALLSGVFSQR